MMNNEMPQSIADLFFEAFSLVRHKRRRPLWWRMNSGQLKTHLLKLTDNRFSEKNYGSRTFTEFVRLFPDQLFVDSSVAPVEVELLAPELRSDFNAAFKGMRDGVIFRFDKSTGTAQEPIETNVELPNLPSIERSELRQLKNHFVENYKSKVRNSSDSSKLKSWSTSANIAELRISEISEYWERALIWFYWGKIEEWLADDAIGAASVNFWGNSFDSEDLIEEDLFGISSKFSSEELGACRANGDLLGVGEILLTLVSRDDQRFNEANIAQAIAAWGSPISGVEEFSSIRDVVDRIDEFDPDALGKSIINVCYRLRQLGLEYPGDIPDLVFRCSNSIEKNYEQDEGLRPTALCDRAVAILGSSKRKFQDAINSFSKTNTISAKNASVEVTREVRALRNLVLSDERALLRELEFLLGVGFRKFCESCERHSGADSIRRADELSEQLKQFQVSGATSRQYSTLFNEYVAPVSAHVRSLLQEGTQRGEDYIRPELSIENSAIKTDLDTTGRLNSFQFNLQNIGHGAGLGIDLQLDIVTDEYEITILEPLESFDLSAQENRFIRVGIILNSPIRALSLPVVIKCVAEGKTDFTFELVVRLERQVTQPDWDALLAEPPYSINPIRERHRLFGRDDVLQALILNATSGSSTFLWGQKRVGKTSVLQVLVSELADFEHLSCSIFRMGELISLHEGQIAHRIAQRLVEDCEVKIDLPTEDEFGAGMSKLVPVAENLLRQNPSKKFLIVIDEFDDLDSSFYMGERGRQFIKALRSLSEIGLTFFFVGSERMLSIYQRHEADLNKWINYSLDRISSRTDRISLIVKPLQDQIEYAPEAVNFMVDYCDGNPFYMNIFCSSVFQICVAGRKTFVSLIDVQNAREQMLRSIGATNFAHLWDDNPELDLDEKEKQSAENCLILAAIASLGGHFESVDDLKGAQEALGLTASDQATAQTFRSGIERLRARGVLVQNDDAETTSVNLAVFRDWLPQNTEFLMQRWRGHLTRVKAAGGDDEREAPNVQIVSAAFPIPEDDLLQVSQRLRYMGRQIDVAQVKIWLRQFDDDVRIEIAFLLLKRLADYGFIDEGTRSEKYRVIEELVAAHRITLGHAWKIVRAKKTNLCVSFVDSETKSGAMAARELGKRLIAGRVVSGDKAGDWMKNSVSDNPILVFVDDFIATGKTMERGLRNFIDKVGVEIFEEFSGKKQILCCAQYAFPEALELLRTAYPSVVFQSAQILDDKVKALSVDSGIFSDPTELAFAKDMLLQLGRELTPQNALGFGDLSALLVFHDSVPNNTSPIFWSNGTVNEKPWKPLFPRS